MIPAPRTPADTARADREAAQDLVSAVRGRPVWGRPVRGVPGAAARRRTRRRARRRNRRKAGDVSEPFLFDAHGIGYVDPDHAHQRGDACRLCTGCYHGHHDQCRHTIVCPGDGHVRSCLCCGLES